MAVSARLRRWSPLSIFHDLAPCCWRCSTRAVRGWILAHPPAATTPPRRRQRQPAHRRAVTPAAPARPRHRRRTRRSILRRCLPKKVRLRPLMEGSVAAVVRGGGQTSTGSVVLSGRDGDHGFVPGPAIPGLFAARRPIRFSSLDAKPELPFALAPEEFRGADRPLPVTIETRASARDVHSARADGGENAPLRHAFAKPRSSRRRLDELPDPFVFGTTILVESRQQRRRSYLPHTAWGPFSPPRMGRAPSGAVWEKWIPTGVKAR